MKNQKDGVYNLDETREITGEELKAEK